MDDGGLRSRALSALLRHDPGGVAGIDRNGWADVARVVAAARERRGIGDAGLSFDEDDLRRIVAEDAKGRFQIAPDGLRVRAVAGHSIEVEIESVPFRPDGPLWFGTVAENAERIAERGLVRGSRSAVRLSPTREHAMAVASARVAGSRDGSDLGGPVVYEIDAVEMAREGATFRMNPAGEIEIDGVPAEHVAPEPGPSPAP